MTPPEQYPAVCQPIEAALIQQVEQERLLNQVTTQIRQSLELPVILETAVQRVRHFFEADRLVIYQFERPLPRPDKAQNSLSERRPDSGSDKTRSVKSKSTTAWPGRVTYEALATESVQSVIGWGEPDHCFTDPHRGENYYRNGMTFAIADVEAAYANHPCLLQQLRLLKVRSKLVAPIVIQDQPWGLLIAHQCWETREWAENEQKFLRHIAEHLAIAIYQAELYAELQQQKQTLEHQVIARTRELRDTLLAAQSANRAKTEFLANVSHEFRSPLTTVIGMSSTLMRWTFGNLSSKQRHYLQTIHDSGKHLLELINDVLDLSQLESGKMVLKIREFSLALLAKQALETFRDAAEKSKIVLILEVNHEQIDPNHLQMTSDLLFRGDRRRIRQILLNLLNNALKFTPEGGQVTLKLWFSEGKAALQVADTGIGIAEDQKPLLFQKFQQLDSSYHRQYPGTGLGLALTQQLVELHNGRIEVETKVGEGSQFTVWLPQQTVSPRSDSSKHASSSPIRTAQIALIENDEELARDLCQVLTDAGYHVIWIMEGLAAIGQIKLLEPEMVVINMRLARTDGNEMIQKLRDLPHGDQMKILALHSPSDFPFQDPAVPNIADDDLYQPIVASEFLSKIESLLVGTRTNQLKR